MNYIQYLKPGGKTKKLSFTQDEIDELNKSMKLMDWVQNNLLLDSRDMEFNIVPTFYNRERHITSDLLDSYLVSRKLQDKYLRHLGYTRDNSGDYGLVKKAVGDRNLPIYQLNKDAINRNPLVVIGNPSSEWMGDFSTEFQDAGNYPTALYVDGLTGNIYLKAWDLNDYGNITGGNLYGFLGNILANIGDKIGNPTVVHTGYLPVISPRFNIDSEDAMALDYDKKVNILDPENYKEKNGKYIPYNKYLRDYLQNNNMHVEKGDDDKLILVNTPDIVVTNKKQTGGTLNYLNY